MKLVAVYLAGRFYMILGMKLLNPICLVALSNQLALAATSQCDSPETALASRSRSQIRSVPAETIAVFSTPSGWQALNEEDAPYLDDEEV